MLLSSRGYGIFRFSPLIQQACKIVTYTRQESANKVNGSGGSNGGSRKRGRQEASQPPASPSEVSGNKEAEAESGSDGGDWGRTAAARKYKRLRQELVSLFAPPCCYQRVNDNATAVLAPYFTLSFPPSFSRIDFVGQCLSGDHSASDRCTSGWEPEKSFVVYTNARRCPTANRYSLEPLYLQLLNRHLVASG